VREQNRLRIERLTARYEARLRDALAPGDADFARAFAEARARVILPQMEEIAAELRKAGHEPRVVLDGACTPGIELFLGLRAATAPRNVIGVGVIREGAAAPEILAYLEVTTTRFDLQRFAQPAELTSPDRVEQLLVDAVEHLISCNTR
jgi:hypothetical protein